MRNQENRLVRCHRNISMSVKVKDNTVTESAQEWLIWNTGTGGRRVPEGFRPGKRSVYISLYSGNKEP